jgi:hypothetical protein
MIRHNRVPRGNGAMHWSMAALRSRSQANVGYEEKDDCEMEKPGEAKSRLHIRPDTSAQVVKPVVIRQNLKNAERRPEQPDNSIVHGPVRFRQVPRD